MNLLFAGTPDIAATVLKTLLSSRHTVLAVLTQPDRPAGRGQKVMESPVKLLATAHQLPIHQPEKLRETGVQDLLRSYDADLMIVVAYGLIIPQAVLDLPKKGCWNIHVSLLPRWRGAAPIQRAIEAGDTKTGVSIMQMDAGLDTGPILLQKKVAIPATMTGGELHDLLAEAGAALLLDALDQEEQGPLHPTSQTTDGITYAHKLTKEEAKVDWIRTAIELANQVRAFNPWPIATMTLQGHPLRLWSAAAHPDKKSSVAPGDIASISAEHLFIQTGQGLLALQEVQAPGGKRLPIKAFLNGHRDRLFYKAP